MTDVTHTDAGAGRGYGPRALGALSIVCVLVACSVGQGTGQATGEIHLPDCGVENAAYSLNPTFFSAEFIEDPATRTPGAVQNMVTLRMQRGSYRESESDGISIFVSDVNAVQELLRSSPDGVAIDIGAAAALAQMTLHLGQTCEIGFPRSRYWTVPGVLEGASGTLVLESVYSPGVPDADGEVIGEFRGTFTDVRFGDVSDPARFAILSGSFAFLYQRGRPAQRFP